jgi:hypothetical protein
MKSTVYLVLGVVLVGLGVLLPLAARISGAQLEHTGPAILAVVFGATFVLKYRTAKIVERVKKDEERRSRTKGWPDSAVWAALKSEVTLKTKDGAIHVWTVPCGELDIPGGRLAACDPVVGLYEELPFVTVPKGRFPVVVTMADVSKELNKSHLREAYASVVFSIGVEVRRECLVPTKGGPKPYVDDGMFIGFGVDSGTACFVDPTVVEPCMPEDQGSWLAGTFEGPNPDSWFSRMDSDEIRKGIANIVLPRATHGENIVIFHSGWGDGSYPLVGGYDKQGGLVAVHIDFGVVP